jgi:hypothetical protein
MSLACPVEKTKLVVVEIENATTKFDSEIGSPRPMIGIGVLIDPPRVMQYGEEGDDFNVCSGFLSQSQAVLKDSGPVGNAMVAGERQGVILENGLEDKWDVH